MRGIVCSDFDLGNHFKHMSSKDALKYEEDQINHFQDFIEKSIELSPDFLFIVGNLFGTYQPRNYTIETVKNGLNELADKGIKIFILPGAHDIPLPFTNDVPIHLLFKNKNIEFLFNKEVSKSTNVRDPIYNIEKDNVNIQVFSVPSPLRKPTELQLELNVKSNFLTFFLMPDISSFKKDVDSIFSTFLKNLDECSLNSLLVGGNFPNVKKLTNCSFDVIHCPQIHQNNFNYADNEHGICLLEIENEKGINKKNIIPISQFDMINEIVEVSNLNPTEINELIYETIRNRSDPSKNIMRLTLIGEMEKENYHNLKLFQYNEMGKRLNYYFELLDRIEFLNSTQAIQGLDVKEELEDFINLKKSSEEQQIVIGDYEIKIDDVYREVLNLIKKNWDLGG
jgi:hypothetical protein